MFLGEDKHSLDGKGRLVMPRRHRDELEDGCVISKDKDRNLMVYPLETYATAVAEPAMAGGDSKESRRRKRSLFSSAEQLSLDGSGRLLIREDLREWAGIADGDNVVIVGMYDHLELWPESKWDSVKEAGDEAFLDDDEEDEDTE